MRMASHLHLCFDLKFEISLIGVVYASQFPFPTPLPDAMIPNRLPSPIRDQNAGLYH